MSTGTNRPYVVRLELRQKLYDAVLSHARVANVSLEDFCRSVCVPMLEEFGTTFRQEGHSAGKVERIRFRLVGQHDIEASLYLSPELETSFFEQARHRMHGSGEYPQRATVFRMLRDLCRPALADHVGVDVSPTMGEE